MPAAYIHENIAKKALKQNENASSYVAENIAAFEIGAQGPDVLFFYGIIRFWEKDRLPNELGEYMHGHKSADFLRAVLKEALNSSPSVKAWALGFVTHYAADTTVHPYVYARTDDPDGSHNTTAHLLLESEFDTWYYRNSGRHGVPRQVKGLKKLTKDQKNNIAAALSRASGRVYPEFKLTQRQAYRAINDMNAVVSILHSPLKIKYYIFRLIEKIVKMPDIIIRHAPAHKLPETDFLNINNESWSNPWDKSLIYNYSFPELFDISVAKAQKYIKTVLGYFGGDIGLGEAASLLGNNHYSSGLPLEK